MNISSGKKRIPLFELAVALVTSFSTCTKKRSIADAYRHFIDLTSKKISRSSFWERLANKKLSEFLHMAVLNYSFNMQQKALSTRSWLSTFTDVFIYDASPIRLPDVLAKLFPGNRTNHSPACIKLSALYQLSTRAIRWLKVAPQKKHDSKILPDLQQLKGALFLFDLGYFSHNFLHDLCLAGVWFVCRLKENSKPVITSVVTGVSKKFIGCQLDNSVSLRGAIVEIWADLALKGKGFVNVRLIGFRMPHTKEYRWYASNLPQARVLAQWIYPIYRLRWQIELFFKSIKSTLNADQVTSGNENIALSFVYSSILASLIANTLLLEEVIALSHIQLKSITAQRIMKVFSLVAYTLAQCLVKKSLPNSYLKCKLESILFLLECPNSKHRPTSLEQIVMLS